MHHKDKLFIINKLVAVPDKGKRLFWAKEVKNINILIETFPEFDFWKGLKFKQKLDSLNLFRSGFYKDELNKKYNLYKYKPPTEKEIILGEKCRPDLNIVKRVKTIKDFLS